MTQAWGPLRIVAVAFCVVALSSCQSADDVQHRKKLEALVQKEASRSEATGVLGPGFTVYEKGTPSWDALQSFLQREPPSNLRPLRENLEKYPTIMYYTTAWRMTWIFIDEKDVVRSFYLTAQ